MTRRLASPCLGASLVLWLAVGVVVLAWFAWQLLARSLAVLLGPLSAAALLVYRPGGHR